MRATAIAAFAFAAVVSASAPLHAQSGSAGPTLRGSWAATAPSNQTFQGMWTAQTSATDSNAATGTWTLVDRSNRIAARGTWSAVRAAGSWSGSWQARIAGNNRLLAGSWRTQLAAPDTRSFTDLLQHTLEEQVSGTWTSGRLRGAWSLRAYK